MAQLKTDEWPDEGEQTTTESQVDDLSPEQSILNTAVDEEERRSEHRPAPTGADDATE